MLYGILSLAGLLAVLMMLALIIHMNSNTHQRIEAVADDKKKKHS